MFVRFYAEPRWSTEHDFQNGNDPYIVTETQNFARVDKSKMLNDRSVYYKIMFLNYAGPSYMIA